MKIRPSRDEIAMSVGRLKGSPLKRGAASPGVPIVTTSSPSGVHFVIVCDPSSAHHTKPSGATTIACVRGVNVPAPNVRA